MRRGLAFQEVVRRELVAVAPYAPGFSVARLTDEQEKLGCPLCAGV